MKSGKDYQSHPSLASSEALLAVFRPVQPMGRNGVRAHADNRLWTADAIHRANNIAQIALSLSRIDPVRFGFVSDGRVSAEMERLGEAYAELGSYGEEPIISCAPLLERITSSLVTLFGPAAIVRLTLKIDDVLLTPDRRRALTLIASELLINALKYAFPHQRGGHVRLSLLNASGTVTLVVEDDGIGITGLEPVGAGTGLLSGMAQLLGADVQSGNGPDGGARFSICFRQQAAELDS